MSNSGKDKKTPSTASIEGPIRVANVAVTEMHNMKQLAKMQNPGKDPKALKALQDICFDLGIMLTNDESSKLSTKMAEFEIEKNKGFPGLLSKKAKSIQRELIYTEAQMLIKKLSPEQLEANHLAYRFVGQDGKPFLVLQAKTSGVEPGVIGIKIYREKDDAKLLGNGEHADHKYHRWCLSAIKLAIEGKTRFPSLQKQTGFQAIVDHLKKAGKENGELKSLIDEYEQINQSTPEGKAERYTKLEEIMALMAQDPKAMSAFQEIIQHHEASKYARKHIYKLTYTERSGDKLALTQEQALKQFFLKKEAEYDKEAAAGIMDNIKAKGYITFGKTKTVTELNEDALTEAVANDMLIDLGFNAQVIKLVAATNGTSSKPQILLDSSWVNKDIRKDTPNIKTASETNSERYHALESTSESAYAFHTFEDSASNPHVALRGGFAVNPKTNKSIADSIVDTDVAAFSMMLLADYDAFGSAGANKGIIPKDGELIFTVIDPGHAFDKYARQLDVHDDFSFQDKLSLIERNGNVFAAERRFKNYTAFQDMPLSKLMKGVWLTAKARGDELPAALRAFLETKPLSEDWQRFQNKLDTIEPGSLTKSFDDKIAGLYALQKQSPGNQATYAQEIDSLAEQRLFVLMQAERHLGPTKQRKLQFEKYDLPVPVGVFEKRMQHSPSDLDMLKNMELLLSETTGTLQSKDRDGNNASIQLKYARRMSNRVEVQISEKNDNHVVLSVGNTAGAAKLFSMLQSLDPDTSMDNEQIKVSRKALEMYALSSPMSHMALETLKANIANISKNAASEQNVEKEAPSRTNKATQRKPSMKRHPTLYIDGTTSESDLSSTNEPLFGKLPPTVMPLAGTTTDSSDDDEGFEFEECFMPPAILVNGPSNDSDSDSAYSSMNSDRGNDAVSMESNIGEIITTQSKIDKMSKTPIDIYDQEATYILNAAMEMGAGKTIDLSNLLSDEAAKQFIKIAEDAYSPEASRSEDFHPLKPLSALLDVYNKDIASNRPKQP